MCLAKLCPTTLSTGYSGAKWKFDQLIKSPLAEGEKLDTYSVAMQYMENIAVVETFQLYRGSLFQSSNAPPLSYMGVSAA